LSSTSQVSPNFWVNPDNRVNYRVSVQTPEYRIHSMDTLLNTPIIKSGTALPSRRDGSGEPSYVAPPQLLSNLVNLKRSIVPANVNHYDVQPVYDVYANVQGRDLAAVATDVQKVVDAIRSDLPRGSSIVMRGQVQTMNSSFTGLAAGLGFAVLLVYFLMVVNF